MTNLNRRGAGWRFRHGLAILILAAIGEAQSTEREPNAEREGFTRRWAGCLELPHSIVARAGHEIHVFDPSAVVLAVTDIVSAIRQKSALPPGN